MSDFDSSNRPVGSDSLVRKPAPGGPAQQIKQVLRSTHGPAAKSSEYHLPPGEIEYSPPLVLCLALITNLLGRPISVDVLKSGLPVNRGETLSVRTALRVAEKSGVLGQVFHRPRLDKMNALALPCILLLKGQNACVLTSMEQGQCYVVFPEKGMSQVKVPLAELSQEYSGYAVFVHLEGRLDARVEALQDTDTRGWFWGNILRFLPIYKHVILTTLVVNVLALAGPLYVMNVYDRVVPNNAHETLWVLSLGVSIAYLFDFLLRNLRGYFVDVAGKNADVIIASRLMQQLTSMRFDYKPDSAGTLANNLREFESLREFFSSTTLIGLVDMPFIFVFIAVIASIGGPLFWAPMAAVPLVVLVGIFVQIPFHKVIEKGYQEGSMKNALLVETLGGIEAVKTSQAESRIQQRWEAVVGMSSRSTAKARALANFTITFSSWAAQLVTVLVIVGGVYLIGKGELTLGGLIACNILVGRTMAPLGTVAAMLTRLQQSRMALRALDVLMKLPTETPAGGEFIHPRQIDPSLTLEQVRFQYPGAQVLALRDLSLHIEKGEKVGIIGRTGSGKSTLGRLFLGLYQPQQGKVLLGGIDLRQLHVADLRSRIGYVSQDNFLFFGTIRENIAFGAPHADDRAILRAAAVAGVTDFVRAHPAGFDWQVGERGMGLSGGQRQAVTIARALLSDPEILILDEPTSSMDNASEQTFRERLASVSKDKTLVLLTHRMGMLTLIDRLVVMDAGRIVADGPRDKVLEALRAGQVHPAATGGSAS